MRDHVMVESTAELFDELADLRDGGFEGSVDEHSIFREVFFVTETRNNGIFVSEAITSDGGFIMQTDEPLCSCSGNSSLTSQIDHAKGVFTGKPSSEYLSGDLASSLKDNNHTRLSNGDLPDVKPASGDTLIVSAPSEGFVSGVSLQDFDSGCYSLTYRVVESSGHGVTSSHYQLNQFLDPGRGYAISGGDGYKNRSSSLDQNDQKESVSPISQESYASKVLVIDPTVSVVKTFGTHRPKKPRWKDHCFLKLEEDELSMPRNIKNDPRPLLRYHINRLLTAAGWVVGRRKRNSKYNGIGEYVYKSPGGRPFREFHRAWSLCGEILLTEAIDFIPKNECMQWADITELWTDLSLAVKEIEDKLNLLEPTSMAHLWCLLDPFANVVFIDKTIRLLKEGITVKVKRSSVVPSDTGSAAKYRKISVAERNRVNIRNQQAYKYDGTCDEDGVHLFDVPIDSGHAPKLLGGPVTVSPHHGNRITSPSLDPGPAAEAGLGCTMEAHKNSRKISKMKLTGDYLGERGNSITETSTDSSRSKKLNSCDLNDDDLLISAIIRTKTGRSTMKWTTSKPKVLRKHKTPKGSCRLLPRTLKKGAKHIIKGKWSVIASRTVLSWLIHSCALSVNEIIQYRNIKDDTVIKEGIITTDGVLCSCCHEVLSISKFSSHAGFRLNRPCVNLFLESGKPLTLCQLEAWSAEYKARKIAPKIDEVVETDQNDDSCGRCGDVGELICCDSCPSAFHEACLFEQELPEGSWYCPQCRCQVCGYAVNDEEISLLHGARKCSQCEDKYHDACIQGSDITVGSAIDTWFCGECCQKVYYGLQSRIGLRNLLSEGFSWTLLRCIPGDKKVHSVQRLVALKAECNSKLAVAITILEECFLPMVDIKTGIDMIPQVIYNWGSQFARLNYNGFYTVVLENDDIIMSVASIRIHGVIVAELPLIATCSKNRRRGMCRRLINCIEEMLKALKVEMLVVSAIPTLVETWTIGFGFQPLEEEERQSLSKINLMVFPGAVWLKKHLCGHHTMDGKNVPSDASTFDSTEVRAYGGGETTVCGQLLDDNLSVKEADIEKGICNTDPEILKSDDGQESGILQNQISNLFVEEEHAPRPSRHSFAVEETTVWTETKKCESDNVLPNEEKLCDVLVYQLSKLDEQKSGQLISL